MPIFIKSLVSVLHFVCTIYMIWCYVDITAVSRSVESFWSGLASYTCFHPLTASSICLHCPNLQDISWPTWCVFIRWYVSTWYIYTS